MNDETDDPVDGAPSEERNRVARRVAVKLPVHVDLGTAREDSAGLTGNVSETGMFVAFKQPPPVGTLARFEIRRTGGEPVRGIGEVTWIRVRWAGKGRPPGMGIHFRFLEPAAQSSLEELIQDGVSRGLQISADIDTDEEAARAPQTEEPVMQHRPYGKPLTLGMTPRSASQPAASARPQSRPQTRADGEDAGVGQGWEALRKWANAPAPVGKKAQEGQTDGLGRSPTPVLGGLSDMAKLGVFGVLLLIFLLVMLL